MAIEDYSYEAVCSYDDGKTSYTVFENFEGREKNSAWVLRETDHEITEPHTVHQGEFYAVVRLVFHAAKFGILDRMTIFAHKEVVNDILQVRETNENSWFLEKVLEYGNGANIQWNYR